MDSFVPELHVLKSQQVLDCKEVAKWMQTTNLSCASLPLKILFFILIQHNGHCLMSKKLGQNAIISATLIYMRPTVL